MQILKSVWNLSSRHFHGNLTVNGTNLHDLTHIAVQEPGTTNYDVNATANFQAAVDVMPPSMGDVMMGSFLAESDASASTQFKASATAYGQAMAMQADASTTRRAHQDYNATTAVVDLTKFQHIAEKRNGEYQEASLKISANASQRDQIRLEAEQRENMRHDIQRSSEEVHAYLENE